MQTKHTSGTWEAVKFESSNDYTIFSDLCSTPIADIWVSDAIPKEETESNAKLIAASPLLLEALKECLFGLEIANKEKPCKGFKNSIKMAQEAINKATN